MLLAQGNGIVSPITASLLPTLLGGMTVNDTLIMRYKETELKQAANEGNFLSLSVIK